eukprot:11853535-Heterocapsa_arctica.AAC.1
MELKQLNAELAGRLRSNMESAENEKLVYELRITELTTHAVTLSNEVKTAEFKAQFLQEAQ